MSKPSQEDRAATAYHEAGHAVLSLRLGVAVLKKGVSIAADQESLGRVHTGRGFRGDPGIGISDLMGVKMEKLAMVCKAGVEAQRSYSPKSVRAFHGHSDRQQVGDLMFRLCGDPEEVAALHRLLKIRVRRIIRSPHVWTQITAIAEALLRTEELTAEEVRRIYGDATLNREAVERAKRHLHGAPSQGPVSVR